MTLPVTEPRPNFSPFPYERLRRVTRREAALESAIARWLAARGGLGERVARLWGGPVRLRIVGTAAALPPDAALAEVRAGGGSFVLAASPAPVRALAQRLLGGPEELAAPRPLGAVEQAIWALAVAAALEDAGVAAEVWPLAGLPADRGGAKDPARLMPHAEPVRRSAAEDPARLMIYLAVELPAGSMTVVVCVPPDLALRAPPPREAPSWSIPLPVVVGRCAIPRDAAAALGPRDIVTIDGALELVLGDGALGLSAAPGAMAAAVATGYVRRDVGLPDEAHLELTVQLGTTRLPLRRITELAVGEIVPLGRPLAGPYEVRVAGQLVGHGELLDVDGELGVRIVSMAHGPGLRSGQE